MNTLRRLVGNPASWRRTLWLWLIPVTIGAGLAALSISGILRIGDGLFFDFATRHEAPHKTQVIVIEPGSGGLTGEQSEEVATAALRLGAQRIVFTADPGPEFQPGKFAPGQVIVGRKASRVPGEGGWQLAGFDRSAKGSAIAAAMIAAPEYGIYRRQLSWLDGGGGRIPLLESAAADQRPSRQIYFVRMPKAQVVPRVKASQIIRGDIAAGELDGLIALISPAPQRESALLSTPVSPNSRATSLTEFSAYAIQTLRDGRAVTAPQIWQSALMLVALCLLLALFYQRFDPKRLAFPLVIAGSLALLGLAWAALQFANLLIPITGLVAGLWLIAGFMVLHSERVQDERLDQFVSRAVNLSFNRLGVRDQAQLPHFLLESARMIGVDRMLLLSVDKRRSVSELGAIDASIGDLGLTGKQLTDQLGLARGWRGSGAADGLVTEWGANAQLAWLGRAEEDVFWVYAFASDARQRNSARLIAAIIGSFREIQRWRAILSSRARLENRYEPIDVKVGSALSMITEQGDQIRHGIDSLETAVMIFHLVGFPLHANAQMAAYYEAAGVPLSETTLPEALARLTDLDPKRIAAMLRDLLHNGGEMRIPARALEARKRILRVAAPVRLAKGSERVLVLEAIDISDLERLAQLRLSVATFIDSQLRNDLEAIALGASLARDDRLGRPALLKVVDRIADVTRRAADRLESVADFTHDSPDDIISACYPIDARKVVSEAHERIAGFAEDLGVSVDAGLPGISGFTIAEPAMLGNLVEAALRVVVADTPPGGTVKLVLEEEAEHSRIRISGGFGVAFERLCAALDAPADDAPPDYRMISKGIKQAMRWKASTSYFSTVGGGYTFNVELRRLG